MPRPSEEFRESVLICLWLSPDNVYTKPSLGEDSIPWDWMKWKLWCYFRKYHGTDIWNSIECFRWYWSSENRRSQFERCLRRSGLLMNCYLMLIECIEHRHSSNKVGFNITNIIRRLLRKKPSYLCIYIVCIKSHISLPNHKAYNKNCTPNKVQGES